MATSQAPLPSSVSQETPPPNTSTSRRKKKGAGAKQRASENFRLNKNEETQRQFDARIEDLRLVCGWSVDDIFGSRAHGAEFPQLSFTVKADFLELIHDVVDVLYDACKMPPSSADPEPRTYDEITLQNVVGYQLFAKQINANKHSLQPYPFSLADQTLCDAIAQQLNDNVAPLAVAVDQIGKFTVEGQTFIPRLHPHSTVHGYYTNPDHPLLLAEARPDLAVTPHVNPVTHRFMGIRLVDAAAAQRAGIVNAQGILNPDFIAHPQNFGFGVGSVTWEDVIPHRERVFSFPVTLARFIELKGRIRKKLTERAILKVSVEMGAGLPSQIVYRGIEDPVTGNSSCYSPRNLPDEQFILGAVLSLGVDQPLSSVEVRSKEISVTTAGGLSSLANLLTKQLR